MTIKSIGMLGLLMAILVTPAAWADDDQRQISVVGRGEIKAVPDMAVISVGVETEAKTPSEALSENTSRMSVVMARLEEAGIAANDLQTSQLSVWPIYADRPTNSNERKITSYRASNQLRVTLRDIERIGKILDQAVGDGANTVNGPSFSVANPEPVLQAARDAAVKDAIAKAKRYAAAADVKLGEVIRIDEAGRTPVIARQMRAEARVASTPIAVGETRISAEVAMVFAIE